MIMTTTTSAVSMATSSTTSAGPINSDMCKQEPLKRIKPAIPMKPKYIPPLPTPASIANIGKLNQQKLAALAKATSHQLQHQRHQQIQKSQFIVPSSPNMGCSKNCCGIFPPNDPRHIHQEQHHQAKVDPHIGSNSNNNNNSKNSNNNNGTPPEGPAGQLNTFANDNRLDTTNEDNAQSDDAYLTTSSQDSIDGGIATESSSSLSSSSGGFKDPDYQLRTEQYVAAKESEYLRMSLPSTNTQSPPNHFEETNHCVRRTAVEPSPARKFSIDLSFDSPKGSPPAHTSNKQHLEQVLAQQQRLMGDHAKGNNRLQSLLGKKQRSTSNSLDGTKLATASAAASASGLTNQPHAQISTTSSSDLNISTIGAKNQQHKLLHDEMKQNCRLIQEKHLIEKRMPQQHYKPVDGYQPEEQVMIINSHSSR